MKPIASPLNIIDFAVINFDFAFIQPKSKNEIVSERFFSEYELDIDFTIHSNEIIQVFMKTEINKSEKKLAGYSIFAEVACLFEFNKELKITEEAKNSMEGFSTIYIALNVLRGFISQFTANAPFGRYILPSVDLNDLIAKKKNVNNKSKKIGNKQKNKKPVIKNKQN